METNQNVGVESTDSTQLKEGRVPSAVEGVAMIATPGPETAAAVASTTLAPPAAPVDLLNTYRTTLVPMAEILAAVSPAQPAGEFIRETPEFEKLHLEINKLVSLNNKIPVDWSLVNATSQGLLIKSKDLSVLGYLIYALYRLHGLQGLAAGVFLNLKFFENFWEDLYPQKSRMRARVAAYRWWRDRLETEIEKFVPDTQTDKEAIQHLAYFLPLLDESAGRLLDEGKKDDSVHKTALLRKVKEYHRNLANLDKAEAEKRQQREKAATQPVSGGAGISLESEFHSEEDIAKALKQVPLVLKNIAAFWRHKNLTDSRSYRINRVAAWLNISQSPPHQNGLTQISGPNMDTLNKYQGLMAASQFSEIIHEVEKNLWLMPFWIDGHRFSVLALTALGPSHGGAKTAILEELALFLKRCVNLHELKFSNNTPFISEECQRWIDAEVKPHLGGGQSSGGALVGVQNKEDNPWLDAAKEAQQLAAKGQIAEALALFHKGQTQAGTERQSFLWRLYQSRFSLDVGQVELAIGQLESLNQHVIQYGLEGWEPEISVEVARLLLICYAKYLKKSKKPLEGLHVKMEELYRRICRLDIKTALAMEEKPWQSH